MRSDMRPYVVFFRNSIPLRQLSVIMTSEGYENIEIDFTSNSMVLDAEQHGRETATKLRHILQTELDEDGFNIVRSKVRMVRLLKQNPLKNQCPSSRMRFLLFERALDKERIASVINWAEDNPGLDVGFALEGATVCLRGESDRYSTSIQKIEEILNLPALDVTRDTIMRAIQIVGEHEKRLETSL